MVSDGVRSRMHVPASSPSIRSFTNSNGSVTLVAKPDLPRDQQTPRSRKWRGVLWWRSSRVHPAPSWKITVNEPLTPRDAAKCAYHSSADSAFTLKTLSPASSEWGIRFNKTRGNGPSLVPVEIEEVVPHSYAERMGLRTGDELVAINGKSVRSWQHAVHLMQKQQSVFASGEIHFDLRREGGRYGAPPPRAPVGGEYVLECARSWTCFSLDRILYVDPSGGCYSPCGTRISVDKRAQILPIKKETISRDTDTVDSDGSVSADHFEQRFEQQVQD